MARYLEIDVSEELLSHVARAVSFGSMVLGRNWWKVYGGIDIRNR